MKELIAHVGFFSVLIVGIVVAAICEYARRIIKAKPKTPTWVLLSALVYVVYVLAVLVVVFNVLSELFI